MTPSNNSMKDGKDTTPSKAKDGSRKGEKNAKEQLTSWIENSSIINPVIAYTVYSIRQGNIEITKSISTHFSPRDINQAKSAIWNKCGSDLASRNFLANGLIGQQTLVLTP